MLEDVAGEAVVSRGDSAEVSGLLVDLTDERHPNPASFTLDDLLRSGPKSLCLVTLDGCFIHISAELLGTLGYSERELAAGLICWNLVVAPELQEAQAHLVAALATERQSENQTTLLARDGRRLSVTIQYALIERHGQSLVAAFITDLTALKESEDRLRLSEERRRMATEAAELGTWFWDLRDNNLVWDARCRRLFGIAADTPVTYGVFLDHVHPDDRNGVHRSVQHSLSNGGEYDVEFRTKPNGEPQRWIRSKGSVIFGPAHTPQTMQGIAIDMTDRRVNEQRVRNVLNSLFAFVMVLTPDGLLTEVNSAPLDAAGLTVEEVVGKPVEDSYWWAYSPEARQKIRRAVQRGRARQRSRSEAWIRVRGGKLILVDLLVAPLLDSHGQVDCLIASAVDITERKRAEELLRLSESNYREVVEGVPQLVWTCDPDGQVCDFVNGRFVQYSGRPPKQPQSMLWFDFVHPAEQPELIECWQRSRQSGEPFEAECRIRSVTGEYRWFQADALPLRDSAGQILRWFGTCTDIDEQRRLSETLQARESELRQTNEELRQFAYAVSHDLKEPLRTISAYTQLLQEAVGPAAGEEANLYMGNVIDGTERLYALLEDLREYMEVGYTAHIDKSSVNMEEVYQAVLRNLNALIQTSSARITHDPLPRILGHRAHLLQLVQNLVSNAIKYRGHRTPTIHIGAERENGHWLFSVRDNGIGIDPQHHEHVFGLFKRLHGRKFQGTGIGLSICQKVVERYGGKIWVDSKAGEGSTFYFTLPAVSK